MITCLSCDKAKHTWLTAVKSSTTALDDITFILQSSTNGTVIYCDLTVNCFYM